ncbi:MAG: glucose-6-phosphate isomerase, partial [Xanthomonadales bacterium]|nr:glucose-6-phosphate isomerase [Xanthomonadales bacterium]
VALRDPGLLEACGRGGEDTGVEAMLATAAALNRGHLPGMPGEAVTDVVHIGLGGSLLGPQLLAEALPAHGPSAPRVHFLGSIDAHARAALLPRLDPATTVAVTVSKSFTTEDTRLHSRRLRDWLVAALGDEPAAARQFAVTARREAALADGFSEDRVLHLPEWVGGRYSAGSAVSLSAAARVGPEAFREFLAGAADIDRHFRDAAPERNLPVLLAAAHLWHRCGRGLPGLGVYCYDARLRLLPAWLQQLSMESLGKSVTADGEPAHLDCAPLLFGDTGTEAQHAVFQALHQGGRVVPVDFVAVVRPDHDDREAHQALLAQLLAQATALAVGRGAEQVDGNPHRVLPGGRPSTLLLLDALTPRALGALLALYEHQVFVEAVALGVNPFDQYGVEFGKEVAAALRPALAGEDAAAESRWPGLSALLRRLRG